MSNILFTYITPFHPLKGGIGRVTDTLTREFQKRGHRVYYLIYRSAITIEHEYDYPAPLIYLPSTKLLSEDNIRFYLRFIEEHSINYVINQSGNFDDSLLWLKAKGSETKIISVLHQEPWISYKHFWHDFIPIKNRRFTEKLKQVARIILYPWMKRAFKKNRIKHFSKILPLSDKVCTLTNRFYKQITEIYPGYEDKYYAIANPNSYQPKELLNYKELSKKKKNKIIYVGLLVKNKRIDRAIKVWKNLEKKYPDWEFTIIGNEDNLDYGSYIRNLAKPCKHITFVGQCDPKPYYESAKIIVLPSNYEGWGMVLTEAMQHGVVPVVFDSSEVFSDILNEGKCGILVKPYNIKAYQAAIESLIRDATMLASMSTHAYEYVKRYNVMNIADKWENLFVHLKQPSVNL